VKEKEYLSNNMKKGNLFDIKDVEGNIDEIIQPLAEGSVRIERIVSHGQITPKNGWFDQESDEWVVLLQGIATILLEDEREIHLTPGDYMLIPAHQKHRVTYTSSSPACVWLAIHGNFS
jgi:cupin 2 domain-containing protein